MSALIGKFPANEAPGRNQLHIFVSRGGVELNITTTERAIALTPIEARAAAHALIAASEEVERIRAPEGVGLGQDTCCFCNGSTLGGVSIIGAGDGSGNGRDGRFAHRACYDRWKKINA